MQIPAARWYNVIPVRRSRRQYVSRPLAADLLQSLQAVCTDFRPFAGARATLITDSPERLFLGVIGSYGKVKGPPACIAFTGDMADPNVQEKTGYLGEGIILEATALGLSTCWVGGFFHKDETAKVVGAGPQEKVLGVTPVGYASNKITFQERLMTGFGRTHQRKKPASMVSGLPEREWPAWARLALAAARLAPSAVNRQPWHFYIEKDSITVSVSKPGNEFNVSKRLDCGIAMLHIEVAALNTDIQGSWEFLKSPQVARYNII